MIEMTVALHRTPRQRCSNCLNRRVCYYIGVNDSIRSEPQCAHCIGIRTRVTTRPRIHPDQVEMFE